MRAKKERIHHKDKYSLISKINEGDNFSHYSTIELDGDRILMENQLIELGFLEISKELKFEDITSHIKISNIK